MVQAQDLQTKVGCEIFEKLLNLTHKHYGFEVKISLDIHF